MEQEIRNLIHNALSELSIEAGNFVVEHPADMAMGDYSTNVAMVHAKNLKQSPKELAEKIISAIRSDLENSKRSDLGEVIAEIKSAGPGFINFYLSPAFFAQSIKEILDNKDFGENSSDTGKKIMVEYTQPNPFKPFHIGHLMSNAIGESISRLVEYSGAQTIRANYQGDVGLHVAKAIYGILNYPLRPDGHLSLAKEEGVPQIAQDIGSCYSWASNLYEEDVSVKEKIDAINKKVYSREDEEINKIYDWGRKITLDAFEIIYKKLGTKFDYYFFEGEMAKRGMEVVKENIGKVFSESDGAVVFKGEDYDPKLHTRVFITKAGLPTYEAKEIGLTLTKFEKENPDLSITETAIEQGEYMKVVQKAVSLMHPDYEKRMLHITHGMMRFASGKMSSRKGNIITGESLIADTEALILEKIKDRELSEEEKTHIASVVGVAAIKYSILRQAVGGDIIYDFEKSISFEGDSGPYLQYSYARAKSVLGKSNHHPASGTPPPQGGESAPLDLERLLYRFPEVVLRARAEYAPHYIASYLIELARSFNAFYGANKIIGGENEEYFLALTQAFSSIMQKGLYLLGIESPEKM